MQKYAFWYQIFFTNFSKIILWSWKEKSRSIETTKTTLYFIGNVCIISAMQIPYYSIDLLYLRILNTLQLTAHTNISMYVMCISP